MQGRSPTRGAACRGALHGCRLWGPPKGVWWTSSAVLRFRSVCLQFRVGRERGRVAAHRGCPTQSRNTVGAVQTPDEKGGGVWPGRGRVGAHPGARPPCGSFSRAVQNPDKRGGGVWTGWDRVGAPPQVPGDHAVHLPGRVPGRPRPLAGQPPRQLRAGHILFVPASRRGHDRARARVQHQRARRAAAAERAALREIRGFKRSPSQAVSPPVTTCHHSVALQSPVPGTVQPVFNMPRACSWPAGAGAHWSAGVGIVSMSLAVVLLAPPASGAAAPLGAAAPPAPAAAAPPALPAADAAARSGTLKSFTARYSSRILHAIFARWLRALPALQSQADAGAACTCTAL